jgi:hypothetical protein
VTRAAKPVKKKIKKKEAASSLMSGSFLFSKFCNGVRRFCNNNGA